MSNEKETCINCKFCEQGKNNSFCGNINQTDEGLKTYVYWNFDCNLFEKGISKSRQEYLLKHKT